MLGNLWLLAFVVAIVVVAVGVPVSTATEPPTPNVGIVDANDAFALDLYAKLESESKGNLFFSPYSVSTALAMTYAGAKGKTATEMVSVLHFAMSQEQVSPAFAALATKLHGEVKKDGYELQIANRLWGAKGYRFLPAFLKLTRDDFGAELAQLDFAGNPEPARRTINKWVEEKTADKIKDMIAPGSLGPATTLVLTNAIYFKGEWQSKFEVRTTRDAPFLLDSERRTTVPTMRQTAMYGYAENDDMQVLELPYRGQKVSMFVLLPKKTDGLADLEKGLSTNKLKQWVSEVKMRMVDVSLPKFKTTSSFRLDKALAAMGMPLAFSGNADFSGMTGNRELFISAVIHKAFVDVTERGTEAAAATAVMMARAARPQKNPVFRADHPFLFLIRDNRTGTVLFLGRLMNPRE